MVSMASMEASPNERPRRTAAAGCAPPSPPIGSGRWFLPVAYLAVTVSICTLSAGCRLTPQTDRDWAPELARAAGADFDWPYVHVHNVRNSTYRSETDFDVRFEERTYDLTKLDSVDYILVPLTGLPKVAHTFVSFGFQGRDYMAISIEVRRLRGQPFRPLYNFLDENEIIYIAGDEKDLIRLRTNFRKDDVYVYRARLTPRQCQTLFVDMLQRANQLSTKPEFYNTLTNNCETNLIAHLNHVLPQRIPYNVEVMFPGLSDRLLFDRKLIQSVGTFDETRSMARINRMAQLHPDGPDFSQQIRRF
jgi:Domain of unknown function (DUF4105)